MNKDSPVGFKLSNAIVEKLGGLYNAVECLKFRKANPDSATSFKQGDVPAAKDLFAGQDSDLPEWLSHMTVGSLLVRDKAAELLDAEQAAHVAKLLAVSVVASGRDWQCTNFPDMMFAKIIASLAGSTFVAGCPISTFEADIEKGCDIVHISERIGEMTREDILKANGFYAYLGPGNAVQIPEGYITFQCNAGCLEMDGVVNTDGGNGCDFLVSWMGRMCCLFSGKGNEQPSTNWLILSLQ